jgi:uncharacterized protein involved in exopolysaccharide biosynthesis
MQSTSTNLQREIPDRCDPVGPVPIADTDKTARERTVSRLRLLWEQRRFLLRAALCGLLAATALAWLVPKRYESTARLMPPDGQSGSGMAVLAAISGRAGTMPGVNDLLGVKTTGSLFVGVLGSRTIQTRLVDQFELRRVYRVRRSEDACRELADTTHISEDRKSGIITLAVSDRSPDRAAALANAYIEALNRMVADLNTSSAHRERIFLEARLQAVQQDLEIAEKDFSQFASKNTAINIPEQGKAMVGAVATLQGQLIAAESELEGLRQIYTDNNLRVRAVRARVAELQRQLERMGGKREGDASDTEANAIYPSVRKLPLLGVTYADLYRKTKVQEAVFETLTQQYELAKVAEARETPSVKILDAASVPEKPSYPPRLLIICLGALLSGVVAVVWVLGSVRWKSLDAQDPAKVLAKEVLKTVRASVVRKASKGRALNPSDEKNEPFEVLPH